MINERHAPTLTCALRRADGGVRCWGCEDDDDGYSCGDGRATPPDDGAAYRSVSAGVRHACALRRDGGTARCWGCHGRVSRRGSPPIVTPGGGG
eukprot:gene56698-biopygen56782